MQQMTLIKCILVEFSSTCIKDRFTVYEWHTEQHYDVWYMCINLQNLTKKWKETNGGGILISNKVKMWLFKQYNTIHKSDRKSPFHSEPWHKQEIGPVWGSVPASSCWSTLAHT